MTKPVQWFKVKLFILDSNDVAEFIVLSSHKSSARNMAIESFHHDTNNDHEHVARATVLPIARPSAGVYVSYNPA